jgi:hypothetical protein
MADGRPGRITEAVQVRLKLLSFSWRHSFKILEEGPFPAILGLDFLQHSQMNIDIVSRTYHFGFAPDISGSFVAREIDSDGVREFDSHVATVAATHSGRLDLEVLKEVSGFIFAQSGHGEMRYL